MKILLTGGCGYIGSHTCVELLSRGHDVVIYDNLSNSKANVVKKIEKITGRRAPFVKGDILDRTALEKLFKKEKFDAVMHFAGLKYVGESVSRPLEYYKNNVCGTVTLMEVMQKYGCNKIVFSSSCTVYGNPKIVPVTEDSPVKDAACPYGDTKITTEHILESAVFADKNLCVITLRYFNPIGAHESGLIGDNNYEQNMLLPCIANVASKRLPYLKIFGNDYDTPDGTCIRDYVHVVDLAVGHILALEKISGAGVNTFNLGTGKGTSVLEMVKSFEKASGIPIPYKIEKRREGDVAAVYADCKKAEKVLGFKAKRTVDDMCRSIIKFMENQ
jgi:UDP-glucose 4-epimerase